MSASVEQVHLISGQTISSSSYPLLLIHGILSNESVWDPILPYIKEVLPNTEVIKIEIGNGDIDSVTMSLEQQMTELSRIIQRNDKLKEGFNVIAHSQGGILIRAYIQFFSHLPGFPNVKRLVQIFSPNGGVYGVPNFSGCIGSCLLNCCGSAPYCCCFAGYSFADYWRDPYNLEAYETSQSVLARLNQCSRLSSNEEKRMNKKTLSELTGWLVIATENDDTVIPYGSPFFDEYKANTKDIIHLDNPEHSLNQNGRDPLGLLQLIKENKIHKCTTTIKHEDGVNVVSKPLYDQVILPFLTCDDPTSRLFIQDVDI
eukprot:TRINITY_DN7366_c0_g1_i1.p1 TRINITY_DN7366_c0_g1~~TRINITY_DN7366_c0_g1_i1.p1  ORF type:complete len:328 (-),score=89.36 TRINITY_DN7366_c0_g1_i1:40-984(-)